MVDFIGISRQPAHILFLVLFFFGLKAFVSFVFCIFDVARNRIAIEDNRIARCQKFLKFFFIIRTWVEPEIEITGILNDCWHQAPPPLVAAVSARALIMRLLIEVSSRLHAREHRVLILARTV